MPDIIPADSLCRFLHLPYLSLSRRATTMGRRAADFMQRWIAENVTADFYGPGDAEALAVKCRADAEEAGFDPDEIEYQAGEDIATLIREATVKRGGW